MDDDSIQASVRTRLQPEKRRSSRGLKRRRALAHDA
jgi:hypothetical protein